MLCDLLTLLLVAGRCEDDTMGPIFIKEPQNRVDFSNTTGATVECSARGHPPPEIIWVRADGTAVGDVPGLRQVQDHALVEEYIQMFTVHTKEKSA